MESLIINPKRILVADKGILVISKGRSLLFSNHSLNVKEDEDFNFIMVNDENWKTFMDTVLSNNNVPVIDLREGK